MTEQDMMTTEGKRDRVRRLVLHPLIADGFRLKRKSGEAHDALEARERAECDRLADALAYMSDKGLRVLREMLATKGEGTARCFWPARATVIGLAEAFEPRPLEDLPGLASWFRSVAGSQALDEGRLVAEFQFWFRKKRPPMSDQDRRLIADKAAEWQSIVERERDRIRRGFRAHDPEFLHWYDTQHARAATLVAEGCRARSGEDAA